jgi:hypothetical protein
VVERRGGKIRVVSGKKRVKEREREERIGCLKEREMIFIFFMLFESGCGVCIDLHGFRWIYVLVTKNMILVASTE